TPARGQRARIHAQTMASGAQVHTAGRIRSARVHAREVVAALLVRTDLGARGEDDPHALEPGLVGATEPISIPVLAHPASNGRREPLRILDGLLRPSRPRQEHGREDEGQPPQGFTSATAVIPVFTSATDTLTRPGVAPATVNRVRPSWVSTAS